MHNVTNIVTISTFLINQDFIAKTLCIQKDNQQGCNGKCHLRQELAKNNSESNQELPAESSKRLALDVFQVTQINTLEYLNLQDFTEKPVTGFYAEILPNLYFDIDTPPPISV